MGKSLTVLKPTSIHRTRDFQQMTQTYRCSTALATALLLASSHWPGPCCCCLSCYYRPHEGATTSGQRSGTGQRRQRQPFLLHFVLGPFPSKIPVPGPRCTSCQQHPQKRVGIEGFNPKKASKPSGVDSTIRRRGMDRVVGRKTFVAIPSQMPKNNTVPLGTLTEHPWNPSWNGLGTCRWTLSSASMCR